MYIERDTDDDSPGATNVGAINLANDQGASLTGEIAELRISGNLGADDNVVCDSVTGDIFVGLNTYNTLDLGDVDSSATITITKDLEGTLSANTLGNVLIYGDAGPSPCRAISLSPRITPARSTWTTAGGTADRDKSI